VFDRASATAIGRQWIWLESVGPPVIARLRGFERDRDEHAWPTQFMCRQADAEFGKHGQQFVGTDVLIADL
jgi:hypothetical protein